MPRPPIDPFEEYPQITSPFIKPIEEDIPKEERKAVNPITFFPKEKSFEEKVYIILYTLNTDDESDTASRTFEVCIGRTAAYSDIKDKLISGLDIDVHRSIIITETLVQVENADAEYYLLPFKNAISIYSFCTSVASYYNTDEFNIEDYSDGDIPEDDGDYYTKAYMTPDQMEYRRLLEDSIKREKFINELREREGISNNLI